MIDGESDTIFRIADRHQPICHIQCHWKTVCSDADSPVRAFGTVQDITEQKDHELQLSESLQEMERLKKYTEHIVQNSPSFVVSTSPEGKTLRIHDVGCRICGYGREEIIGNHLWLTLFPGDSYQQVKNLLAHYAARGWVKDFEMSFTTVDITRSALGASGLPPSRLELEGFIIDQSARCYRRFTRVAGARS